MDDLKRYLQQNLDGLDVDEPGFAVWDQIEKQFLPQKTLVVPLFAKRLAVACIILLAGIGIYFLLGKEQAGDIHIATMPTPNVLKPIFPDAKLSEKPENKNAIVNNGEKDFFTEPAATKEKSKRNRSLRKTPIDPVTENFNRMEYSYASMVDMQLTRIRKTPVYAEEAGYFHVFKKQFADLNADEKQVKAAIAQNGLSDQLVTQMITIYQEKIGLLKQLQQEISKMNNRAHDLEKNTVNTPSFINL